MARAGRGYSRAPPPTSRTSTQPCSWRCPGPRGLGDRPPHEVAPPDPRRMTSLRRSSITAAGGTGRLRGREPKRPGDPRQGLMRPLRVARPRLVELPPRVHHASDLDDVARGVQAVVGRTGVGLEIALESLDRSFPDGPPPGRGFGAKG